MSEEEKNLTQVFTFTISDSYPLQMCFKHDGLWSIAMPRHSGYSRFLRHPCSVNGRIVKLY